MLLFRDLDSATSLYWGMETPGLTITLNVLELLRYGITIIALILAQAAVFAVIAYGYVAAAIAVLLGPIFIPFFIVPQMEWLFWGWLKSLIQYSFYPVVGNAYVFVFGNLLIHFVDSHPPPYDGGNHGGFLLSARVSVDRLYVRNSQDSVTREFILYRQVRRVRLPRL